MPTATGLLRKGDQFRHNESGQVLIVLSRIGGKKSGYSVKVRKRDGSNFGSNGQDNLVVEEADWHFLQSGRWQLLEDEAAT